MFTKKIIKILEVQKKSENEKQNKFEVAASTTLILQSLPQTNVCRPKYQQRN